MQAAQQHGLLKSNLEAVLQKCCWRSGWGASGVLNHGKLISQSSQNKCPISVESVNENKRYIFQAPNGSQLEPHVLDAIAEVTVNNFTDAQLTDARFVSKWFQQNLRPFLPSVSMEFLSCLSTKYFSCETYQVVYVQRVLCKMSKKMSGRSTYQWSVRQVVM